MWPKYKSRIVILQLLILLDFIAIISTNFLIIRNTTFVCEDGQLEFRHEELSDEDKMVILESKGGHVLSSYMASDHRSAAENFINLLPFPSTEEEERQLNQPPSDSNPRDDTDSFKKLFNEKTFKRKADVLKYLNEIAKESEIITNNTEAGKPSISQKQKSTKGRISRRGRHKRHVKSSNHRTSHTPSASGLGHLNSTVLHNFPFVPPEKIGLKSSHFSKTPGVETTIEYCFDRGMPVPDGQHLHMCAACAATITLQATYFPPVINEVICNPEDYNCFVEDNIPHGACRQTEMVIDVLRRKDGYCTLALKNDEIVIVDEWELSQYLRNVGCECTIHKDSKYADLVRVN